MDQQTNTGLAYAQQGLYQRIKRRQSAYETRRQLYDDQRDVICELLRPDLVKGKVGEKDEGGFGSSAIVEGTGPASAQIWQRGFLGNMISRKSDWFRDKLKEPPRWTGVSFKGNDEVNLYLQDFSDHMSDRYQRSNYYDVMPQFVLDAGTVGSPVMLAEKDIVSDRTIFKVTDYTSVWLDKDVFGYDNCLHVEWEWTALEAAQFFGVQNLPPLVQAHMRNGNHYAKTKYLQCIYGTADPIYKDLADIPQTHPWLEHFICMAATEGPEQTPLTPLNKGPGYFTRPFSTWHYHRNWHEVYSKTMAWWAIYDIRGNNAMWDALFGEAELALRPPTWAMESIRGLLDLGPGGQMFARNAQEYETPPKFVERPTSYTTAIDFADRLKAAIERHFHVPFFLAVTMAMNRKEQPETAFGLMRAEAEGTGQLAPQVETYENQVLAHTHEVLIDAERMAEPAYPWGRLPEPPQIAMEYSDGEVDVEFIGQLSMAQVRDREILKFYRNIGSAELIFNASPEAIHKVRWPEALERVLEAGDFPQSDLVPKEEYDALIDAMRQRAAQAELAEQAPKIAQAAKALQGKTENGSPLQLMSGSKA